MSNETSSEDAEAYRPLTMDDWCDVGRVAKHCCPHCYDRLLKERHESLTKRRRFAVTCHPVLIGHSCLERLTRAEIETLIHTLMEGRAMDEWGEEETLT